MIGIFTLIQGKNLLPRHALISDKSAILVLIVNLTHNFIVIKRFFTFLQSKVNI